MEEVFVDIEGYDSEYQISNKGNVRSHKGKKPKLMTLCLNKQGYYYVKLIKNKKYKHHTIHRLVALHFIHNPDNKPFVNHKNGIKTDIFVDNLEWSTQSENTQHAYDNGLNYTSNKSVALLIQRNIESAKKVVQIDPVTKEFIKTWDSVTGAANELSLCAGDISKCCKGYRLRTVGGYVWRHEDNLDVEYKGRYKSKK